MPGPCFLLIIKKKKNFFQDMYKAKIVISLKLMLLPTYLYYQYYSVLPICIQD